MNLYVQVTSSSDWRLALLLRDWLRADATARSDLEEVERRLIDRLPADPEQHEAGTRSWFASATPVAEEWAGRVGWQPPAPG